MRGRRFSHEQREAIAKARAKQKQACARGNHHWWPEYGWTEDSQNRSGLEPKYWTIKQRFPMPDWDGKSLICSARKCKTRCQMKSVSLRTQKRMEEIVKSFMENTATMRKEYLAEQDLKGGA